MSKNKCFSGITFCISGTLSQPRRQIVKLIEQHGGSFSPTVTQRVNYLVGTDIEDWTSKRQKARDHGVPVVSEQFLHDSISKRKAVSADKYLLETTKEISNTPNNNNNSSGSDSNYESEEAEDSRAGTKKSKKRPMKETQEETTEEETRGKKQKGAECHIEFVERHLFTPENHQKIHGFFKKQIVAASEMMLGEHCNTVERLLDENEGVDEVYVVRGKHAGTMYTLVFTHCGGNVGGCVFQGQTLKPFGFLEDDGLSIDDRKNKNNKDKELERALNNFFEENRTWTKAD